MQNQDKLKKISEQLEIQHLYQKIIDLVKKKPQVAATILSLWLNPKSPEGPSKNKRRAP